jgi:hypothetical protein
MHEHSETIYSAFFIGIICLVQYHVNDLVYVCDSLRSVSRISKTLLYISCKICEYNKMLVDTLAYWHGFRGDVSMPLCFHVSNAHFLNRFL